jgi:predicted dienelactone hydrolase
MRHLPLLLVSWSIACSPEGPDDSVRTDAGPTDPVPVADLGAPGPWQVGTTERQIEGADGQPLTVQLWYPTTTTAGPYLYDGLLSGVAAPDADPDCTESRPLLAFSHGSGGVRYQSAFLTEHLASHGWVVVAPDHRGNTFVDAIPNFPELVLRRPQDIVDAVDAALVEPVLDGCLADDTYAVAGHSFGGYTSFALAGAEVNSPAGGTVDLGDPRVTAVVGLAPWDAAGGITDGTREVAVPTLVLTGALDETTPLAQVHRLYDPLVVEERWLGVFPEGGHFSFSPVACLLFVGDGCGDDYLPTDRVEALTNLSTSAFLEHVRGTEGAIEQLPTDVAGLEFE